jgi:membrane protease YdiL (CAAX protease family)
MKVSTLLRRHSLLTYFGLAFTISWTGCLLAAGPKFVTGEPMQPVDGLLVFLAMLLGPASSGVALTAYFDGRSGLRELLSRMKERRFKLAWYLGLLVFPALIVVVVVALGALVSREFVLTFAPLGIPIGLMAGFFEEIGWTGYALPRMLGKRSALSVAIYLGLLHTMWHLMADFLTASGARGVYWLPHFVTFVVSMTAMRVFVVWAYANTGSLLLAQLMHASSTGFLAVLVPLSLTAAQDTLFYAVYSVVLWGAVVAVVALFGRDLTRSRAG